MALLIVKAALLITLVTVFQNGHSCALRIEPVPERFNTKIDRELNITCVPDGPTYWAKRIQTLQLVKEDKTVAIVRRDGVNLGPASKPNMQAEGNITRDTIHSYLRVTVNKPDKDDVGTYTCLMFYEDVDFQIREERSSANVTVDNQDLSSMVTFLFEKVVQLEKTVQDQEKELKQQDKALKQEKGINSKENKLLKKQVSDLEINLLYQQNYTMSLETDLLKQQNYTKELEKSIKEQGKQLMDQDEKGMNQSLLIQEIMERDSFSVAFSVYGTNSARFINGETLIFKEYILNIGDHYDLSTGVFTTPRKGLYVFHLFAWNVPNVHTWIQLKVNDVSMAELYAHDNAHSDQSSVSTVILLKEGDRVWPYFRSGSQLGNTNEKLTVFNGYLLKLL